MLFFYTTIILLQTIGHLGLSYLPCNPANYCRSSGIVCRETVIDSFPADDTAMIYVVVSSTIDPV